MFSAPAACPWTKLKVYKIRKLSSLLNESVISFYRLYQCCIIIYIYMDTILCVYSPVNICILIWFSNRYTPLTWCLNGLDLYLYFLFFCYQTTELTYIVKGNGIRRKLWNLFLNFISTFMIDSFIHTHLNIYIQVQIYREIARD